jgi:hypothetical protein
MKGLFGSALRAFTPAANPVDGVQVINGIPQPTDMPMRGAPQPNLERSYLGGLLRYQRPDGQTPQDRMALIGATLGDMGGALNGSGGGNLARVQERFRADRQRQAASGLMGRLFPDDPDAAALADADPSLASEAWQAKHKPEEWKAVEAEDGLYLFNPRTQQTIKKVAWTRKADDPVYQEYLRSQTEANRARAGMLGNQGDYYGAKAKQPYAPQRPRMAKPGGAVGGSAPAGWR